MTGSMTITIEWNNEMFFKDWRICDQSIVDFPELDTNRFYYIQSQAWALKGYLGGTHSYCTFYHDNKWMVAEITDMETLDIQNAMVVYNDTESEEKGPFISDRLYNAKWFGHAPYIVDSCISPQYDDILEACRNYPIKKFKLLTDNCNTFTSYLIAKLNLRLKRPIRSVGFKNRKWWKRKYNV